MIFTSAFLSFYAKFVSLNKLLFFTFYLLVLTFLNLWFQQADVN